MELEFARPPRTAAQADAGAQAAAENAALSEQNRLEFARLRRYEPLQKLTDAALLDLKPHMRAIEVGSGGKVFRTGDKDDWVYFLLKGKVSLSNDDGVSRLLEAHQPDSMTPLAPGVPRTETATAQENSAVLRVPGSLLEVLLSPPEDSAYEVEEISDQDAEVDHRLMFEILEDYRSDRLNIPSLPEVVVRIRQAVDDPDVTFDKVDRIVVADPGVAARLVQVANSAAYATSNPLGSVRDAISRIGLDTTRDLVTALAMNNVFKTESRVLKTRMHGLWQHSTRVAAISYHLAELTRAVNPDLAMLGGLIHDIGGIAIIAHAPHYPELIETPELLTRTIELLRADVGGLILRHWNFPDDLITVAIESDEWDRDGSSADCCDVVLVSQLLSFVGKPEFGRYPAVSKVPAFARLGLLQQRAEDTLALLNSADQSIDEMQRMLLASSG